jgi:hypothetical protein
MPPAIDLARRYAEALTALRAVHDFDDWLGQFWDDRCPPAASAPTSLTALGANGTIAWHESGDVVVGYLPDMDGCFRIPRGALMPDFPASGSAWSLPYGQDVIISAAMRDEDETRVVR